MSFNNFGGGLVNTIVAGAGNDISAGLTNQLTSNISFSVGDVLASTVQLSSGYALDEGANYLTSQVSSLVPTSVGNGIANAVATQVATVGISSLRGFAERTVTNIFSGQPIFSGLNTGATANKGTVSVPMSVVEQLPDADYGGSAYSITPDVVFSIVPANSGPQTEPQPETFPYTEADIGFDPKFAGATPGINALKGTTALEGASTGSVFGGGSKALSTFGGANYSKIDTTTLSGTPAIKGYW
jgi:hypothetical protein